jgi:hypothetical protein
MNQMYIVTITDGNVDSLEYTLRSIDEHDFNYYKNLIISKKKLKKLNKIFKTKKRIFIYKKNSSIYQAMNLGLKKVNDNCIIFLNAGDKFFSKSSLKKIFYYLNKYDFKTCLMFISILKDNKNYFIPKRKVFFSSNFLTHSSFIRPPTKNDFGFNKKNKITADGKWMKDNVKKFNIKKIYVPLTLFSLGGVSNFPSKKSLKMKINNGVIAISKELLKFILLKIVGINLFYKIIYYFKYDKIEYKEISKFFKKK